MKRPMVALLTQLLVALRSRFFRRMRLEAENLVLRQQLVAPRRKSRKRVRLCNIDRLVFVCVYRLYPALLDAIIIVRPETVLRWHRRGFRAYWRWHSRCAECGAPLNARCASCGAENEAAEKFCGECGAPRHAIGLALVK